LRYPKQNPSVLDALVAASLGAAYVAETRVLLPDLDPLRAFFVPLLLVVPLVFRRRVPLTGATLVAAGLLVQYVVGLDQSESITPIFVLLVAAYSVAAHADLRRALGGGLVLVATVITAITIDTGISLGDYAFTSLLLGSAWTIGRAMRARAQDVKTLESRTADLERAGSEQARLAIARERARIARELHDIVGHRLSVIVVQAGGAEEIMKDRSDQAVEALRAIRTNGRRALAEMRQLLGLLRSEEEDDLAPQPSLSDTASLVKELEKAGLQVNVVTEGVPHPLPPGIDLSAFRILQEALTNVVKHSGSRSASVKITYAEEELRMEISDEGGPPQVTGGGSGLGLIGMKERASLYGGRLEAGRTETGGFAVTARLPLDEGLA
jgi:signal transduction histidine kinase